jgi:hypothetical protein
MNPENTLDLIDEAGKLSEKIHALEEKLKEMKKKIAKNIVYPENKKTGHVFGSIYEAVVSKKETKKWDQNELGKLRQKYGDGPFFNVFSWEFKPISSKIVEIELTNGTMKDDIDKAFTIVENSPSFTFKKLEME